MPEEFGRYRLIELIGRGGMGEVYRARDTVREREVALKLLPDYLAGDESFETRFRRESRLAARLNEPHIIPIHDFGEIDGRLFLDMRLVEGRDLGSVLETRGRLPLAMAVDIVSQAASALDAAHASDLVHRDVKPSNILLTGLHDDPDATPFAYLVDFGIARSTTQEGTALTATTATVGTVAYMSPERISGSASDRRTDVYALACVLYESLTGRKPFEGEMFAQMFAHMNTDPPTASALRPDVPPALDAVITKGMAKSPDDRYPTAGALAAAARLAVRDAGRMRPAGEAPASRPTNPLGAGPGALLTPPPGRGPGPQPGAGARAGGPGGPGRPGGPGVPGSVRPAGGDEPPGGGPAGGWTPPPPPRGPATPTGGFRDATPSGGLPTGATRAVPGHPDRGRRNALIGAAAVVVLALGVLVAVLVSRSGGSPSASGSSSARTSGPRTSTPPSTPTISGPALRTGSASTQVSFDHFASFTQLAGKSQKDTANAFNHGSCDLSAAGSADQALGVADELVCTYSGSPESTTIARFTDATKVQKYVEDRIDTDGFRELVWTHDGQPRGLTYISPATGAGHATIATTFCGLPNYLVQITAPDRKKTSTLTLYNDIWNKAVFPDVNPPQCASSFTSAASGAAVTASSTAHKNVAPLTSGTIQTLIGTGDGSTSVTQVAVGATIEVMSLGQQGKVSFWTADNDTLTRSGSSTYPYAPSSLGPPGATGSGAVLTGMKHATFVVRGTFSTDHSGNAVAYTFGSGGWGAIKAQPNGNLKPSGTGVGLKGIGLSADFGLVGGRLQTVDCSSAIPIAQCSGNNRVIKFWSWRTDQFVQTGHAGRTR